MAKQNNWQKGAKNGLKGAIAVLIAGIIAAGVCCMGFASRDGEGKWFKNFKNLSDWHWSEKNNESEGKVPSDIENSANSVQISDGSGVGAKFSVRALKAAEYEEYGISTQSVSGAYTAKVTLANHSEATDKSITLTASFNDSNYASQNNIAEFIEFSSATVQSGENFTITCKKAFGSQITITATANGVKDGETKPHCSIKADYIKRLKQIDLSIGVSSDLTNQFDYVSYTLSTIDSEPIKNNITTNMDTYVYEETNIPAPNNGLSLNTYDDPAYSTIGSTDEWYTDFQMYYSYQANDNVYTGGTAIPETPGANGALEDMITDSFDWSIYSYCGDVVTFWNNVMEDFLREAEEGRTYSELLSMYNSQTPIGTLFISFTGTRTGINYVFRTNVVLDPRYIYVSAQSPSFDTGNIIF